MWDSFETEPLSGAEKPCDNREPSQGQPWFRSLVDTVKKYKEEIFGNDSSTFIKQRRMVEYTVPPNYKFVFARYPDSFYRAATIMGRSKKLQLFIVFFYHNRKCIYVKPRDILLKHGNLLGMKVCFCREGRTRKGVVYGNNSPANHGFPEMFFIRKKSTWYKINFKDVFLTKRQISRMYFVSPKKHGLGYSKNENETSGTIDMSFQ